VCCENAPIVSSIQASDRQRNEQFAKMTADMSDLKAAMAKLSTEKRRR